MTNYFMRECISLKSILIISYLLNWRLATSNNYDSLQHISKSCGNFSSNLFQALTEDSQDNVISSPFSAYVVLSMLFHGAEGTTKRELESALQLLNPTVFQYDLKHALTSLSATDKAEFDIANSMYVDSHLIVKNAFLHQCKDYFKTSLEKINFENSADSAKKINAWVKEKTKGKISHIINPNDIDSYTKVILLNTLYFKSSWLEQFEPDLTENKKFINFDGNEILTPTMMKRCNLPHGHIKSLNAKFIKMKYMDTDFEMIIVLPNEKYGLAEVEQNFSWDLIAKAVFSTKEIELSLPKFKIETNLNLKSALGQLGVSLIFQERANFSLVSDESLYISQMLQKLFIEVDEKGSEAAVTTAAHMRARRMIVDYDDFTVDHPFMFIIQHEPSSIPLYIGSVKKLGETIVKDEL